MRHSARRGHLQGRCALRTNYFIWAGVKRYANRGNGFNLGFAYPTVVIDADLRSWALPFAIHAGGPLLGKPGFHFRIGPINIGWSLL